MVNAGRQVIGQSTEEFDSSFGEVWIRGFKEGETQLRILDPINKWWRYKEHYSKAVGHFPCKQQDDCVGCTDLNERVRNVSTRYAFNALNAEGRTVVHKIGGKLKKRLQNAEQRLANGDITGRDIVIVRIGKGFSDTEYDYEWGDAYELDEAQKPNDDELNDIGQIVTDKYYAVEAAYESGDAVEDDETNNTDEDHDDGGGDTREAKPGKRPAKAVAAPKPEAAEPDEAKPRARLGKKAAAAKPEPEGDEAQNLTQPEPEPAADPEPEPQASGGVDDAVVADMIVRFKAMEPDELRDMLNEAEIEFPARAAKPRLVALCEKGLKEGKIAPF